jgi:2-Cys peroxiredoxin 5
LDALKKHGVDEVIVYCVNDGAVMKAWAKDQGVGEGSIMTLMGDPSGALTRALEIEMTHPGPAGVGIIGRSKRTAMYVEDGVVKVFKISEGPDDPAGDSFPEDTCAPSMISAIEELHPFLKDEL